MQLHSLTLGSVVSFFLLAITSGAQTPADAKAQIAADVEAMHKQTQVMIDMVFSFGELGFHEVETSKYLTGILERRVSASNAASPACRRPGWPHGVRASP